MEVSDLLDLTVREVLDEYCVLFNPECNYIYGVTTWEMLLKWINEYNIKEEYPESICFEKLIDDKVWIHNEVIDEDKIKLIMENLGISRKGDVDEV